MPELEEFPAVGQREYHAKRSLEAARTDAPRMEPETRKRGFFERLTGRGKKPTDSREDHASSALQRRIQPHQPDNSYGVGPDRGTHRDDWATEESKRQERPDFPAFFNRARR
jgi:hypothetical protein